MGKLLLFVLVAILAYLFFKGSGRRTGSPPGGGAKRSRPAERMVECAHCGVHLPESEAVKQADRYFCCDEHRRLAG